MLFVITCLDKPGHGHVRAENREAHLGYLDVLGDALITAGPILSDDGEKPEGSVLIVDFESRAAAEAFAAGDPYNKAGLFEQVCIRRWKQVFPKTGSFAGRKP